MLKIRLIKRADETYRVQKEVSFLGIRLWISLNSGGEYSSTKFSDLLSAKKCFDAAIATYKKEQAIALVGGASKVLEVVKEEAVA